MLDNSLRFTGAAKTVREHPMAMSGDGLRRLALTDDAHRVFVLTDRQAV